MIKSLGIMVKLPLVHLTLSGRPILAGCCMETELLSLNFTSKIERFEGVSLCGGKKQVVCFVSRYYFPSLAHYSYNRRRLTFFDRQCSFHLFFLTLISLKLLISYGNFDSSSSLSLVFLKICVLSRIAKPKTTKNLKL